MAVAQIMIVGYGLLNTQIASMSLKSVFTTMPLMETVTIGT